MGTPRRTRSARQVRDLFALVADRYGVALVAADALEVEASRHGTPLPDDVAPPERDESEHLFGTAFGFGQVAGGGSGLSFTLTTATATMPSSPAGPSRTAIAVTTLAVVGLAVLWNQAIFAVLGRPWWALFPSVAGGIGIGLAGAKLLFARERNRTAASGDARG
jgi:hypothetical protein